MVLGDMRRSDTRRLTNVIHGRAVHTGERSTYGEYYKIMAYSNTKEYINIKN